MKRLTEMLRTEKTIKGRVRLDRMERSTPRGRGSMSQGLEVKINMAHV